MAQLIKNWTNQVRRVLLAGVGVAFLAKDEVQDLVDRLVAKGETAERDGRKLVSGLLVNPTKGVIDQLGKRTRGFKKNVATSLHTAQDLARTVQTRWTKRVEKTLSKLNLVSSRDVADLNSKIDQLARKIDRLGKK